MSQTKDESNIEEVFIPVLKEIGYPGFDMDIISMGLVLEAKQVGSKAVIRLRAIAAPPDVREKLENAIAAAMSNIPGVKELELELPEAQKPEAPQGPQAIPGVKAVVPVASGKGGVGKSTVAVNLALGLAAEGLKVGLLDLDLYGPSVPMMLGAKDAQPHADERQLFPVETLGIKVLSIGFLMGSDQALIWRGALVMKAVRQLLHEVAWGPLDVLVLDLPPGTGDVQITMTQETPITGAVVVTTPQDVALIDAVKAVDMFRHTDTPVLGIVENMSYFVCPNCDSRHEIFGHGSVEPLCKKLGVKFLGELPLDPVVRSLMDEGRPAISNGGTSGEAYTALARRVAALLDKTPPAKEAVQ